VPASVTLDSSGSATFTATGGAPSKPVSATITATYQGASAQSSLVAEPQGGHCPHPCDCGDGVQHCVPNCAAFCGSQ
jgi:hypothetical protein